MMHRIDVYVEKTKTDGKKPVIYHKKVFSCWYPQKEQAIKAKIALQKMPKGMRAFVPGENRPPKTIMLGGYTVSEVFEDNRFLPIVLLASRVFN